MSYFDQIQYIAHVDKADNILGKIEKWQAHKEGILHRAFTICLHYEDKIILQHRKHPVFGGILDATISSHQTYDGEELQSDETAILNTLKREWFIEQTDLIGGLNMKGKVYYKAQDPRSAYIEHEVCYVYSCAMKNLVLPNFEFAYGFSLCDPEELKDKKGALYPQLAPWVKEMIEKKLI
ncbi:MAG: hypothetical protein ACEQSA_05315 [Weeksellaceae bacterium]